jgi:hypothetical protein
MEVDTVNKGPDHDVAQRKLRPWQNLVSEWHGPVPLVYSNLYVGQQGMCGRGAAVRACFQSCISWTRRQCQWTSE